MRVKSLLLILYLVYSFNSLAQITAQGQGGRTVLWSALAIEQGVSKKFVFRGTIGYSRNSGLNSYNPFLYKGIFTVRQETDYRINKGWKLSMGFLYATRAYEDEFHPHYINEFRIYPKIEQKFTKGRIVFSQYLRIDFRNFYRPQFYQWHKPFELRTRYLMKMTIPLDEKDKKFFAVMTEFLAASDEEIEVNGRKKFEKFQFTENRTSAYYRHHFNKADIWFDLGIMHQWWRDTSADKFRHTYMLQTDIIIVNPFKRK